MATDSTTVYQTLDPEIAAKKLALYDELETYLTSLRDAETPLPAQGIVGTTADQQRAAAMGRAGIGAYADYLSNAQQMLGQAAQQYGQIGQGIGQLMGPIGSEQIQRYMDPYQEAVMQDQLSEMRRQANIQRQQAMGAATQAGAFGGSRQAIVESEMGRNLAAMQNQAINQSLSQNYAQALAAAEREQQRALQGYQTMGQMAQGLGNLAVQQGALGQTGQEMLGRDVNTLLSLGAQEQAQRQREADALYNIEAGEYYRPLTEAAYLSDFLTGVPSSQMTMTSKTTADPSIAQQVGGTIIGGVSTAKAAKDIGLL